MTIRKTQVSTRRFQILENPSPGTITLLIILAITVLALADISARAGRADAWAAVCGECRTVESAPSLINTSFSTPITGARHDVSLSSR